LVVGTELPAITTRPIDTSIVPAVAVWSSVPDWVALAAIDCGLAGVPIMSVLVLAIVMDTTQSLC
jgi:hypothetical protein